MADLLIILFVFIVLVLYYDVNLQSFVQQNEDIKSINTTNSTHYDMYKKSVAYYNETQYKYLAGFYSTIYRREFLYYLLQ